MVKKIIIVGNNNKIKSKTEKKRNGMEWREREVRGNINTNKFVLSMKVRL